MRRIVLPLLAVASFALVSFVAIPLVVDQTKAVPAAGVPLPVSELSGFHGPALWKMRAFEQGREHCIEVRIEIESRDHDGSRTCGTFVGKGSEPDAGPTLGTIDAGKSELALFGETGPAVRKLVLTTGTQEISVMTTSLDWKSPPTSRFYVLFFKETRTATVSTFGSEGELLRRTDISFTDGDLDIPR
jgi:hypothetical protein